MITKKIFLASSSELKEDRQEFEVFVNRKNKDWVSKGFFFELVVWEDFLDAVSQTRLQDEYNSAIRNCDIFVMLFSTKVGQYTEEEFETAFRQFKETNRPLIFTYFKDTAISVASADRKELQSLWAFQEKLHTIGHFYTAYKNVDELKFKFNQQLDKLATKSDGVAPVLEYFCYISTNKIDDLLVDSDRTDWPSLRTADTLAEVEFLIGGNVPYGRSDIIQPKTLRREYASKLREALSKLRPYIQAFSWTEDRYTSGSVCWARLRFSRETTSTDGIIRLVAIDEQKRLELYCSLSNFSGRLVKDGKWVENSTSHAFFNESSMMFFEAVFFVTDFNDNTVVGSPLFLKIPITKGVLM